MPEDNTDPKTQQPAATGADKAASAAPSQPAAAPAADEQHKTADQPAAAPAANEQQQTADQPAAAAPAAGEQISKLQDDLLRAKAENQNIAKRMRAEIGRAELRGIETVLADMLAIADNLEQALQHGADNAGALRDGVALTLSAFNSVLSTHGMQIIDPEPGTKLDPHLHMAISSESHQSYATNSILRVVLKGYQHNQRILRPANVIVTKPDAAPDAGAKPGGGK